MIEVKNLTAIRFESCFEPYQLFPGGGNHPRVPWPKWRGEIYDHEYHHRLYLPHGGKYYRGRV